MILRNKGWPLTSSHVSITSNVAEGPMYANKNREYKACKSKLPGRCSVISSIESLTLNPSRVLGAETFRARQISPYRCLISAQSSSEEVMSKSWTLSLRLDLVWSESPAIASGSWLLLLETSIPVEKSFEEFSDSVRARHKNLIQGSVISARWEISSAKFALPVTSSIIFLGRSGYSSTVLRNSSTHRANLPWSRRFREW